MKNKIKDYCKIAVVVIMSLSFMWIFPHDNDGINYSFLEVALAGASLLGGLLGSKKPEKQKVPKPIDIFAQTAIKNKRGKVTGYGPSLLQKQASGLQSYYQDQAPGLAALSRSTMETLSPEQARLTQIGLGQAEAAQRQIGLFGGTAQSAMSQYGSRIGTYDPTLSDISGYTEVTTPEEQAKALHDTQMAQQMAQESFARRGVLSPEEQRVAQQQAREASSASGRIGGNAGIAAEIMNREAAMAARRGEAANLGQVAYNQGMGALQQRLETQQARYQQLGSERERELARRQNLFAQGLSAGQLNLQERQLGFGQMMDIEQQKARLAEQARAANASAFEMAGQFYTQPGLSMLNMPISMAQQYAGAQGQANIEQFKTNQQRQAASQQMIGSGLGMLGSTFGNQSSFSNLSGLLGSGQNANAYTAFGGGGLSLGASGRSASARPA